MTPFDERACLAMLLAFYPIVSPASLVQARSERPEYFAGARLIGHSGDKIELPDGRIFDVILAVDGPAAGRKWQMLEAGPGGDASPWPLEPGPLTPLDEPSDAPRPASTAFESLVAGALSSLAGADGVLHSAASNLSEAAAQSARVAGDGSELADVEQVVAEIDASRAGEELADVVRQADGLAGAIESTDADYDEPPPDVPMPQEPDLQGAPQEDDGTGPAPGREDPDPGHGNLPGQQDK